MSLRRNTNLMNMEKKKDEKEDLSAAKRDMLLRFIKDQESLQTGHTDLKPSNNDATFDILDGLTVSKEISRNTHYKGSGHLTDNMTNKTNEDGNLNLKPKKTDTASRREQKYNRIMSSKTRRPNECQPLDKWEHGKLNPSVGNVGTKEDIELKLNSILHPAIERSWPGRHQRRLKSAPSVSLATDSRHYLRKEELHVLEGRKLKAKKVSLSIVVPRECDVEQDLTRKQSVTCAHITRPLHRASSVGISSVDLHLLDRRTVSSLTGPCVPVFHLPPIAPEGSSPPST